MDFATVPGRMPFAPSVILPETMRFSYTACAGRHAASNKKVNNVIPTRTSLLLVALSELQGISGNSAAGIFAGIFAFPLGLSAPNRHVVWTNRLASTASADSFGSKLTLVEV